MYRAMAMAITGVIVLASTTGLRAENCSQAPNDVDACFAKEGCAWQITGQRQAACKPFTKTVGLDVVQWSYKKDEPKRLTRRENGKKAVKVEKKSFNRFNLSRQCPPEVLNYHLNHQIKPSLLGVNLPSSEFLVWPNVTSDTDRLEQIVDAVDAHHALRKGGYCKRNWKKLQPKLTAMTKNNWSKAERGNPFTGVIDCRSGGVYIMPQRRCEAKLSQTGWKKRKLEKIIWSADGKTLKKKDQLHAVALDAATNQSFNLSHGDLAAIIKNKAATHQTLGGSCRFEREVRANFLGFTLWPDLETGEPHFKFTSRQLNATNNPNYAITSDRTNVYVKRGKKKVRIFNGDGRIINEDRDSSDRVTRGVVTSDQVGRLSNKMIEVLEREFAKLGPRPALSKFLEYKKCQ